MLGETQSWSGCFGVEERLLPVPCITHGKLAYSLIVTSMVQSWFHLPHESAVLFVHTSLMAALAKN